MANYKSFSSYGINQGRSDIVAGLRRVGYGWMR